MTGAPPRGKESVVSGRPRPRLSARTVAKGVGIALALLVVVPALFVYFILAASKPPLDGAISAEGLAAPVFVL